MIEIACSGKVCVAMNEHPLPLVFVGHRKGEVRRNHALDKILQLHWLQRLLRSICNDENVLVREDIPKNSQKTDVNPTSMNVHERTNRDLM